MQEGFSDLSVIQAPVVAINVMRSGPGIGGIQPAQADYFQVTRGGGNGDYHIIVYAPKSIQEACEMIYNAFDGNRKHISDETVYETELVR